jgi:phosphoribosyl 1,2-cyclic phosphodiesterase
MKLKFYGTRGSIPVCDPGFQKFGGNTTSYQLTFPEVNRVAVIDAGTGIRNLGRDLKASGHRQDLLVMAFTHFHWDHIQGFPFFLPAYDPQQKITILTMGEDQPVDNLRGIFETQMQSVYFPVQLDCMGANFSFLQIQKAQEEFRLSNNIPTNLTALKQRHPGGSYGFRVERNGKVLVICTDLEHEDQVEPAVVKLAEGADLLVHEAQYTSEELKTRKGWGHSSYEQAMDVAEKAGVKRLVMTHHDPDHDDEFLLKMEKKCQERIRDCVLAREGMELEI